MLNNIFDYLLLWSLFTIWLVILMNTILGTSGFLVYLENIRKRNIPRLLNEYPYVSILIPAHNEGKVIEKTVQAILDFEYENDKYEIIVINDNSSDNSAQILAQMQAKNPGRYLKVINTDSQIGGKGKSNALNIGFAQSNGDYIVIYDADNTPEKTALRELVYAMMNDSKAGAVIGKFRCRNKNRNLLTRFVNLEGIYFQWMAQAGRWKLFKLCTIPGTNFIMRRSILDEIGGWDTKAVTEDTEISFRIYQMGYHIQFCPFSTTWEQEPETLSVWFKQRKRWVKGNYYVMFKNFPNLFNKKMGPVRLDILYFLSVYILFFSAAITSDIIFILGFTGFIETTIIGYSFLLWLAAYIIFVLSVQISTSVERNELTLSNFIIIVFMYFSYCKLWTIVALVGFISFIQDILFKRETKWYKTERF